MIDEKEQRSFADGDSCMALMKGGEHAYAYNVQAVVDGAGDAIVAADLTNHAPEAGHLPGLVGRVRELRAVVPLPPDEATTARADAGYFSADNIAEDGGGIDLLIAAGRAYPATVAILKRAAWPVDAFGVDAARDVWVCPAGKLLTRQMPVPGARGHPAKDRYPTAPTRRTARAARSGYSV
jgi:hypothetical protein